MSISPVKSEPELSALVSPTSSVRKEVFSYLGAFQNPEFIDTMIALRNDNTRGIERVKNRPKYDFLYDEWGLQGVCLAYSLETIPWVERYGEQSRLPLLMEGRPHEHMRHLQKLLILSVFQSMAKGMDPKRVHRAIENREVINRIVHNYAALQERRTGIGMVESFPGPTFFEAEAMPLALANFERRCNAKPPTKDDHYIFLMGFGPIFMWHVVYVNPALGVIGDAASGLIWKIDAKSKRFFHDALNYFMQLNDYGKCTSIIHLKRRVQPKPTPLLLSRVVRRAQTAWAIGRNSGLLNGFQYLGEIHRYNPLTLYFFPDKQGVIEKMWGCDLKALLPIIRDNQLAISQFTKKDKELLFFRIHENSLIYHEQCLDVLAILEKIHALGKKTEAFSLFMHEIILRQVAEILRYAPKMPNFPKTTHLTTTFVPRLLELRKASSCPKYDLNRFLYFTTDQELLALLIQHGAVKE